MALQILSVQQAAALVKPGDSVMVGGFLNCGSPEKIVDELLAQNTKDLTLIANDSSFPDKGIGKLVVNKQIKKLIASHIGTNPETGRQMNAGEMQVELVPQGTLAERIRSAGFGLGGILTPTGVGTPVEEGKKVIEIDDKKYLLELPLRANVALLKAYKADKMGNLVFYRSARNFNPLMATAADIVIVEVENLVEVGELDPDAIVTPGIFVNYLVMSDGGI